jgi:outer membrane receptor protein involved in Fe transport
VVAAPVHGRLTIGQALGAALKGAGWHARAVGAQTWRIEPGADPDLHRASHAAPPETSGEDLTVTGTKRSLSLRDLPMSGEVVTLGGGSNLRPPPDAASLAARLPGLTLGGPGAGQSRLFLQGVADSAFNGAAPATVAVVVDNARISYAGAAPEVRLVDVDRVEVLEGPQGTLYGAGTLGGIYRVVTNRPDPERASGDWTGWTGGTAHGGLDGGGSAVVNLPLVAGAVALRAVGYGDHAAGWVQSAGQDATNASDTAAGRLALAASPGGGWRIDATLLGQSIHTANSGYVYAPDTLDRPAQAVEPSASSIDHAALTVTGPLGTGELVVTSGRTVLNTRLAFDATQGAGDFGLSDPALFHEMTRERLWDNEVRATGHSGRLSWVTGLSWFLVDYDRWHSLTGTAGETVGLDVMARSTSEIAGFADLSRTFARHWQIDLGARLLRDTLDETLAVPGNATSATVQRHTGVSPSAALSWHPGTATTAFARVASAFRQGELDQEDTGSTGKNATFAGDHLTTAELGVRQVLKGDGLLTVSAHYTRWNDMSADTLLANNIIATRDAGAAQIVGVQGQMRITPVRGWRIETGWELEAAHLVRNQLGIALDDTRLPVVPAYTARLGALRAFPMLGGAAELGGDLRQIGPGRLSFDPELDRRIAPRLETGLSGEIRWSHVLAAIRIDNLANARSDTYAYGNPFRLTTSPQFVPMRPRTVLLSLGFRP